MWQFADKHTEGFCTIVIFGMFFTFLIIKFFIEYLILRKPKETKKTEVPYQEDK